MDHSCQKGSGADRASLIVASILILGLLRLRALQGCGVHGMIMFEIGFQHRRQLIPEGNFALRVIAIFGRHSSLAKIGEQARHILIEIALKEDPIEPVESCYGVLTVLVRHPAPNGRRREVTDLQIIEPVPKLIAEDEILIGHEIAIGIYEALDDWANRRIIGPLPAREEVAKRRFEAGFGFAKNRDKTGVWEFGQSTCQSSVRRSQANPSITLQPIGIVAAESGAICLLESMI
ncbi:hypothetical protein M529_13930 [Sphingobium ummariense RL-3]|uniref:Uncharacterized protein n=1 Tax=Sphingobium ummariense RL-3 TaxID=1346791 RepID=T0J0T1_9SPHN|nr:hypothetical protein M529_13930 [Sphingobium ummariense RL-3]